MAREPVKDRLRSHRALWQLGKVSTLEVLCNAVVERPERPAFELLMARVAELLNSLIDGTSRKRTHLSKIHHQVRGCLLRDFAFLVGRDPIAHVIPVRSHATDSRRKHRVEIPKDIDCVTARELHI